MKPRTTSDEFHPAAKNTPLFTGDALRDSAVSETEKLVEASTFLHKVNPLRCSRRKNRKP